MSDKLALYIIDSNEKKFMRVMDMSHYDDKFSVTDQKLLIKAPGFNIYRSIVIGVDFNVLISTVNLHNTHEPADLVDGIYTIKYSISNDTVWVEYKHLRTTSILNRYYSVLASLEIDCNLDKEKHEKLRLLNDVKNYIEAAKVYVEYKSSSERGMRLYEYASNKLSKLE